jgi:hypothetical protein
LIKEIGKTRERGLIREIVKRRGLIKEKYKEFIKEIVK